MAFIRHGGDFAYPVGDASRVNRLHRAQAAPGSDRNSRRHSRCGGRAGRSRRAARTGDPARRRARPRAGSRMDIAPARVGLARPPEAKDERRSPADDDRQGGRKSFVGKRGQKQERVRLIARAGKRPRRSGDARDARGANLLGETRRLKASASGGLDCSLAGRERRCAGAPSDRRWFEVKSGRRSEKGRRKYKARSRDGR